MTPVQIHPNERSWLIDLISDINEFLKKCNLKIKRAGGEFSVIGEDKHMFPDLLLFGDDERTQILQGWEAKLPDTPITDSAFVDDAIRKANTLGLNSCFIWNFNTGILFIKNEETGDFENVNEWHNPELQTRRDVEEHKDEWLPQIQDILTYIDDFLESGKISGAKLDTTLSDNILTSIITRNQVSVADELRNKARTNSVVSAFIQEWWYEAFSSAEEYSEREGLVEYAKTILLNWAVKILFAHLIKRYHNPANAVETLRIGTSISDACGIFAGITSKCDFYGIFANIEYCECLSPTAWNDLIEFNGFLTEQGVAKISPKGLQEILERSIAVSKRELNGQYATPLKLAEILVKMTVKNWEGEFLDPCCGTGTIPGIVLNEKLKKLTKKVEAAKTTFASDKFAYPLQATSINLANPETINQPLLIFQENVLLLNRHSQISVIDPKDGTELNIKLPKFCSIASNLPFVEFEHITDSDKSAITDIVHEVIEHTGLSLDPKGDFYTYIPFALWHILCSNGHLGIIVSNSWLGTDFGKAFFECLRYYYTISQVHISGEGRWFKNAAVVTTILILDKKDEIVAPQESEKTQFYIWKKSLEQLDSGDIQKIVNSSLLNKELDKDIVSVKGYLTSEIDALINMHVSLNSLFYDISWLLEIKKKLIPLTSVFDIFRGERRGWDPLFYPQNHDIEQEYIKKGLKSSRSVSRFLAEPDIDVFCCSDSIEELKKQGKTGTLNWIDKFKNGVNEKGKPLPDVLSKGHKLWYGMNDSSRADIFTTMNPDKRLFFGIFNEPTFINQRLIGLRNREPYSNTKLNHMLLNSLLGMFYIEAVGFGRGLGALDMSKTSLSKMYILDPNLISETDCKNLSAKFEPIFNRDIEDTEHELNREDRIEFEKAVLSAYGIEEYYDRIKNSLLSMQKARISVKP